MVRHSSAKIKGSSGGHRGNGSREKKSKLYRILYINIVVAVWVTIILVCGLVWFLFDLPNPENLNKFATRSPTITVLAADGSEIGRRGDFFGNYRKLSDIPVALQLAVLAVEDRRFYEHHGIDPRGIVRALFVNLRAGRIRQGGSTITQQLAKNLFLTRERTIRRKVQESILALWLEKRFTKEEIMEVYLNRVYFGAGCFGVEAAADRYFGTSTHKLSLYESAVIAGLLKAPSRDNPRASPKRSAKRTKQVLKGMIAEGWITDDEASSALRSGQKPILANSRNTKVTTNDVDTMGAGYFMDWIFDQIKSLVTAPDRDLIIETTLRPDLQKIAESAVRSALYGAHSQNVRQGALVALTPDGEVAAMVGGRDYRVSQFNRVSQAQRQPGSVFKLFVYLAAIESGLEPDSKVSDEPVMVDGWKPRNFSRKFSGKVTLRESMARSINAVAVRLGEEVGRNKVVEAARRLGITTDLEIDPSIALGVHELSLLELTGAYTVIANGGYGIWPHGIRSIRDPNGVILYQRKGSGLGRIVSTKHTMALNDILSSVILWGTGKEAQLERPAAGKTGTSQGYRDAWFIGYTPNLIAGVWLGNDNAESMNRVTGGSLAAPVWRRFMNKALIGYPYMALPGAG